MIQRIIQILLTGVHSNKSSKCFLSVGLIWFVLFLNSSQLFGQRNFSPVASAYANSSIIPYSQNIFIEPSVKDQDFARKRVLKAKNGVDFHLRTFFSQADYREQLFKFFPGKRKQLDADFVQKSLSLKNLVLGNGFYVPVQLVKWEHMHGAMASYSSIGPDGKPRMYINQEYAEG